MNDDFDFDHFFDDLKSSLDDDSPFVEVEPRQATPTPPPEPPQEPRKAPARETAPRKREARPAPAKQAKKKSSPIKTIIYIALIIICLVVIVKSCGGGKDEPQATPEPIATETTAPTPEADDTEETQLDFNTVISYIESVLAANYGDNYSVDYDAPMLNVSVWGDGVSLGAAFAANGNDEVKASWDTTMDAMVSLCNSIQDVLNESGHSDVVAVVNVLNDANHDKTLAMISFGSVLYDSVNGINLLGVDE